MSLASSLQRSLYTYVLVDPRLIYMDQPTMSLSPLDVGRVLELIETINQQGVTVFMVEQNANLALQIAHYGYILQNGQIVLVRSFSELLNNPQIRDAYLSGETVSQI